MQACRQSTNKYRRKYQKRKFSFFSLLIKREIKNLRFVCVHISVIEKERKSRDFGFDERQFHFYVRAKINFRPSLLIILFLSFSVFVFHETWFIK